MGFESEDELSSLAQPVLVDRFGSAHTREIREFAYGGGKTDFVIARVSSPYLQRRVKDLNLGIPMPERGILKTFLQIHRRDKVTREYLLDEVLPDSITASALEWLLDNGFVQEIRNKLQSKQYLRKHITSTYAFEFKISDWRKALEQAFRAKCYTRRQYVVLDSDYSHRADIDEFEKYNVGLLSINDSGHLTENVSSSPTAPATPVTEWALNEATLTRHNI